MIPKYLYSSTTGIPWTLFPIIWCVLLSFLTYIIADFFLLISSLFNMHHCSVYIKILLRSSTLPLTMMTMSSAYAKILLPVY